MCVRNTLAFVFCLTVFSVHALAKEIAFTFDDAPRAGTSCLDAKTRSQRLIQQLQQAAPVPAMFMVTTKNLQQHGEQALNAYVGAGHLLGNHSHAHQHPERLGLESYLADVQQAQQQLQRWPQYRPYYRFPFLNEGRSIDMRDGIRSGLKQLGLKPAYVTVDNYDWYMDHLLQKALQEGRTLNMAALRVWYVEEMMRSIRFYDAVAEANLGRSPRHVLLLHENDLAALFLADLIAALAGEGWKVISPLAAYQDPLAETLPDTLFNNQGRVAALAHLNGVKRRDLVPFNEEEDYLDQAFAERVLTATAHTEDDDISVWCANVKSSGSLP